jgi:hypothetical protein
MDEPTPELDPRKRRCAVSGDGAAHPLAVWRDRHGLSMKKFGQMSRTTASTICRIEHNKLHPSPDLVSRIRQATRGEVVLSPRRLLLARGHQTRS